MEFRKLTDEQWNSLQSFMPPSPKRGHSCLDDRKDRLEIFAIELK